MLTASIVSFIPSDGSRRKSGHVLTTETTEYTEMTSDDITEQIIGAAIDVHRELGPGLLESVYEACLSHELSQRQLRAERQKPMPLKYKGASIDCGYRIDLLVECQVVVELKSVARIEPIHQAQLLSYLKLSGCHVGLLVNFNVQQLVKGLRRLVV
jgi:GxxExxY protein